MSLKEKTPKGWQCLSLGEIFHIERGGSPRPIKNYITDAADGVNWIKIGDTQGVTKYIYTTKEKIKPEGVSKSRMVYEDDFILSNSMSFGHPYIMKTNGCIHDGWLVIRNKKDVVDTNYLYHILASKLVYNQFTNLAKGSTVKNLNIEAAKQTVIYVPPLPEQQQIVSKIEELFSELDKGVEGLKVVQQQLKVYRQAVLKWAFEGRLTNDNVKEIKKIGQVASLINGDRGKNYPNRNEYVDVGLPFINTGNILPNGLLELSTINYISREKFNSLNSGKIQPNDLIYCLRGATIGKTAVMTQFCEGAISSSLVIVRPSASVLPMYLYYYLVSPNSRRLISQFDNGTAQPNLSAKSLSQYAIPVFSTTTQMKIVQEIESRLSVCDKIEETITNSLKEAEALRQSILKRAFEGKLV